MLERAKIRVFLCDSTKFDKRSLYKLTNLNDVDFAVLDKEYEGLTASTALL